MWRVMVGIALAGISLVLGGCTLQSAATPTPQVEEIVFSSWPDDMPQTVLDAFTNETGIRVRYDSYDDQGTAAQTVQDEYRYDIVIMNSELVAALRATNSLAPLDRSLLPNLRNISLNFRDLAHDPDNQYSVPFNWGAISILFRNDLVDSRQMRTWADLWDHDGIIMATAVPRDLVSIALRSLGYSINTQDPVQLAAAAERLQAIKPRLRFLNDDESSVVPFLVSGEVTMAIAYAAEAEEALAESDVIEYLLPTDGSILWGDNFVIPANSPHQEAAHLFLNFIMRGDISAMMMEGNRYPAPNDPGLRLLPDDLQNNRLIFPAINLLPRPAEIALPVNEETRALHEAMWTALTEESG
jgi:spermidine/putrescine transport system substrate-binding protein